MKTKLLQSQTGNSKCPRFNAQQTGDLTPSSCSCPFPSIPGPGHLVKGANSPSPCNILQLGFFPCGIHLNLLSAPSAKRSKAMTTFLDDVIRGILPKISQCKTNTIPLHYQGLIPSWECRLISLKHDTTY